MDTFWQFKLRGWNFLRIFWQSFTPPPHAWIWDSLFQKISGHRVHFFPHLNVFVPWERFSSPPSVLEKWGEAMFSSNINYDLSRDFWPPDPRCFLTFMTNNILTKRLSLSKGFRGGFNCCTCSTSLANDIIILSSFYLRCLKNIVYPLLSMSTLCEKDI